MVMVGGGGIGLRYLRHVADCEGQVVRSGVPYVEGVELALNVPALHGVHARSAVAVAGEL